MAEQITTAAELDALPIGTVVEWVYNYATLFPREVCESSPNYLIHGAGNAWMGGLSGKYDVGSRFIFQNPPVSLRVMWRPDQQPPMEHYQLLGIGMVCACRGSWPCPDAEGVAEPRVSANSRSVANDPVAATPDQRLVPLPKPGDGCCCDWYSEDRGGGYFETMQEYEPACPEHSEHVYNPRTGVWEFAARPESVVKVEARQEAYREWFCKDALVSRGYYLVRCADCGGSGVFPVPSGYEGDSSCVACKATGVLPLSQVDPDALAALDRAEVDTKADGWDEGLEAAATWTPVGPSGIPHDPPRNPYRADRIEAGR